MEKILFVLTRMNLGGTEKSLLNLLDTYSPEEEDVTILLLRKEGQLIDEIPEWVKVKETEYYDTIDYELNTSPFKVTLNYLKRFRIIRAINILYKHIWFRITKNRAPYYKYVFKGYKIEGNYDTAIVYEGPYDQTTALVLFCVKAKQKIQWIHFDVSKYLFHKETCRVLYPQFSQINVVSKDARESLVRLIPEIKEKTKVVYNVISKRKCRELAEIGQGYSDNFKGIRILTVGRLSEEKGQEIIPEIASLLYKEGLNFRWYIIGEGYLYTEIKERIKEYNVSDCVILLGSINNPYPFFKEADIYVQTSKHEGYGLTLAEAKVFNLPIVATNCAAAYEQLEGRKSSYVVPRESMAIVSAIIRVLT